MTCQALCDIACDTVGEGATYEPRMCDNSGGGNCQGVFALGPENSAGPEAPSGIDFHGA